MTRRTVFAGLGALAAVLCLGVAAVLCVGASTLWEPTDCIEAQPGEVIHFPGAETSYAHITLPESARSLGSECSVWLDTTIDLWFDMDADELDAFIAQSSLGGPLGEPATPPGFGPDPRAGSFAVFDFGFQDCSAAAQTRCNLSIWVETTDPLVYHVSVAFGYGE